MSRLRVITGLLALLTGSASASTLEQLPLPQLVEKSSVIVRASVTSCRASMRGRLIYTVCALTIQESWKGAAAGSIEVWTPGGSVNGLRQSFSGAPVFQSGDERVFFLWRSPSGIFQVLGLSQGVVRIEKDTDGTLMAVRSPSTERMLDRAGRPVWDEGIDMPLAELKRAASGRGDR
jgi:hypothetical protein